MTSKEKAKKIISGFYPIVETHSKDPALGYKQAEAILASGVSLIQLRERGLSPSLYRELALEMAYLKIHNSFSLILNHEVQLAKEMGADGVHLRATSMPVEKAREILGDHIIIGRSVHSVEEGVFAEKAGADYLLAGSIFKSDQKPADHPMLQIPHLAQLVQSVPIPVIAIGGITKDNLLEVKKTGIAGFSCLRALGENPAEEIKELQKLWCHCERL